MPRDRNCVKITTAFYEWQLPLAALLCVAVNGFQQRGGIGKMSGNNENFIVLYQTENGKITINVRFENETFWLTQKAIAELFESERSVITKHLLNIYEEEELDKEATCAKIAQVQTEGRREVTRMLEKENLTFFLVP